ncbi:MAG: methylated-DNA--[protein]-cysteine S-methyltransferase [Dehalococcoidales bacterium]|jgi:methylated-DNA-[protein]-cysteine S-methyltransferase|nr:methylated-DNA--[protein]-cysteine S-methyltransferase [Dehalococcoidales bacterium]
MEGELKYVTFDTEMGWVGLLASARGLLAATLPQPTDQAAHYSLGSRANQAVRSPASLTDLTELLKDYFRGKQVTFPDRLDLAGNTPFERAVWRMTRAIPYAETRSYLWVATRINKPGAARAVGQALGRNPLAIIIPCHRVVATDGGLGGFGGGLEMKQSLLSLEADGNLRRK